jgi:hypothetical protein
MPNNKSRRRNKAGRDPTPPIQVSIKREDLAVLQEPSPDIIPFVRETCRGSKTF